MDKTRKVRYLKAGERVPPGEPRRYAMSSGYVRLRWRIGRGEYVEVREHRVRDGIVVDAPHVHHRNGCRDDNRAENLQPVGTGEHGVEHRKIDRAEAARLYRAGASTTEIAKILACSAGQLSRALRAEGVEMRHGAPNRIEIDFDLLRVLHAQGVRERAMAPLLGTTRQVVRRARREIGLPPFPPGRPNAGNPPPGEL